MLQSVPMFFKGIKDCHINIDDNFEQPSVIKLKLRAYQRRAVKWMIEKENNNDLLKSDRSPFSGGILADEAGLGKKLELFCCIAANTSPPGFNNKKIELKNFISVIKSDSDSFKVKCDCVIAPKNSSLVVCAYCGKNQHAECVHFKPNPFQEVPFLCGNCWPLNDKIQCKATLIVVPQPILNLWIIEVEVCIKKSGFKVLVYNGVEDCGYYQPIMFRDYDIVLTSYENVSKELKHVQYFNVQNQSTSYLRHSKKYDDFLSPLSCIKWWRICLNIGSNYKIMKNTLKSLESLECTHKWIITDTPVQNSLNDLHGILKLLDVSPYNDRSQFLQFLKNENSLTYEWFSKVIWRNSVIDLVNSELVLPKLTTENHWLTFSENEIYFYENLHNTYAKKFSDIDNSTFFDLPLKNINEEINSYVNGLFIELRQACLHPQTINKQKLELKGIMPMDKLIDTLFEKCQNQCEDIFSQLLVCLDVIAGTYLRLSKPAISVECYKDMLNLIESYEKNINIDPLKKIHAMNSLIETFNEYPEVPQNSSDLDLKENMEQLENKYMSSSLDKIESTRRIVRNYSSRIAKLTNRRNFNYSNWWHRLLKWFCSSKYILRQVRAELKDSHIPGVPNIANKLKSVNGIFNILSIWFDDLNLARHKIIGILKPLEKAPIYEIVQVANNNVEKNRSLLCKAKSQLELYESLLFSICDKQENEPINNTAVNDDETKNESTNKGSLKISQKELLLMSNKLFHYGRAKLIKNKCFKEATIHLEILELLREEFRFLKLLWIHYKEYVNNKVDLIEKKNKLHVVFVPKELPGSIAFTPVLTEYKLDDTEFLKGVDIQPYANLMSKKLPVHKTNLKNKLASLYYIKNKKNNVNSTEHNRCPICISDIKLRWAVLLCGHYLCYKCVVEMANHSSDNKIKIQCPLCRDESEINSTHYAKINEENDLSSTVIKGTFSSKIENITIKLMELIVQDPNVKVILISAWDFAINNLGAALGLNSINYKILEFGDKYCETIIEFKTNSKINALLMTSSLISKGLHFFEATRVFFIEPTVNRDDELAAINLIHKFGQTKSTFAHHFIFRDSIEENITNLFSNNQSYKWDDIKFSQMVSLFNRCQT